MGKKVFAMLLAVVLFAVSGPVEAIAWTETDGAEGQAAVEAEAVTESEAAEAPEVQSEENGQDNTDQSSTDQNGTDENGTDQNSTDQNGTDENSTDQNSTDQNGTDVSGTDQNGADQSGTDQDGTEPDVPVVVATEEEGLKVNVTATAVTGNSADIEWEPVEGALYYAVTLGEEEPQLTDNETLSFSFTGLTANTSYTAKVAAFGDNDEVVAEGQVEFLTEEAVKPAKVKNFRTISSYNSVILKWKKSVGVDSYKIYWTGSNGTKGTIKNIKKSATSRKFKISEKNRKVKYTFKIVAVKDGVESDKVTKKDSAVQLMTLKVTLKINKPALKNHDRPEGKYTISLKAGTTIETIGFTNGKYVFQKKVKGKLRTFHVTRISVRNQKVNYIGKYKKKDGWRMVQPIYTKEEAEAFVNAVGVKSKTKHLIWINQYSQRIFVFKGSKGKWKLIKQCKKDEDGSAGWMVASGKPTSPTSTGLTSIKDRMRANGVPFWNVTTWFSIHGNNPRAWGPLGWPKSGACTRNTNAHAEWIFYNTKMGTAVYVY